MVSIILLASCCVAGSLTLGPEVAADRLSHRVLGDRASEFSFEQISAENGTDVFEFECAEGQCVVRGSSGVAMASGLNQYLKTYCLASVSWCGDQLDLPKPLPPASKTRQITPYKHRYYFNYCTFSYTMAWWDWKRWEREIDWMALNGVNMPLSVTGQEAIWQKVYLDLGLTQEDLDEFFVGPAYLPFGWMGCMDEWGGPLSQAWIDEHLELEKKILARERELGMTPVLQGFTGHVPGAIGDKIPEAKLQRVSDWCGFPGTFFLDPSDPLFQRIGTAFIQEQTRQFGTDHLYASDTFIEMSPPSNDPEFLTGMGRAVYQAMAAPDPEAVWVMQGWVFVNNPKFWQPAQAQALFKAVPDDRMILLDLFCDVDPAWSKTQAFYGKPWIWSIVHDFGGNVTAFGDLSGIAQGPPAALKSPDRGRLCGLGMMMEGIEQNPIVYDLMTEMTWRTEAPDLDLWVRDHARRRYGRSLPKAEEAWQILKETVYACKGAPGPGYALRPSLNAVPVGGVSLPYDPLKLARACEALLSCREELKGKDTYQYDVVNLTRQVLANLSGPLVGEALDACRAGDRARLAEARDRYLDLVWDSDRLLATRPEFLLGRWISQARRWGKTREEKNHLEWNARNQITLWGPAQSVLHEYATKQWSGLIAGFYLPRWEMFFDQVEYSLKSGQPLDEKKFTQDIQSWEETWTHETVPFPAQPHGDPVDRALEMFLKYEPISEGTWAK